MTRLRSDFSFIVLITTSLILAANLGYALFLYVRHVVMAVGFPYPLEYGEGLVLDQILRLASGANIYRSAITTPPYTISNAPPLYMLLQIPFVRIFGPAFWYGRAISVISLLVTAIFLSLTLYQLTKDRLASAVAGLLLFSIPYFWNWSVIDRVDTLALALSWAGLFVIVQNPDRRRNLLAACLLMAGATFTQDTYALVAPVTAVVWLLQSRRSRQAVGLLAGVGGLCAAFYLVINSITQGGFYLNLVTFNANRWNYQEVAGRLIEVAFNSFILGLIALFFLSAERLGRPGRSWPFVWPYFIAAGLVTLLVGKAGTNDGYVYELAAALCLVTGAAVAWLKNHWVKAAVLILITIQVSSYYYWTTEQYLPQFTEKISSRAEIAQMARLVQQSDGPILVDEYNGLLPLAGKALYYQPFEFAQLMQAGLWDPAPLLADITQRKFSILMIYFPRDFRITRSRWPEFIYSAFWKTYTNTDNLASTLICLPGK